VISLKVLQGESAGREIPAGRFPFSIGRAATSDFRSQDSGVWDHHAVLSPDPNFPGFRVAAGPNALVILNGESVHDARFRNGDVLELGSLKLSCSLAPARQSSGRLWEWLTYGTGFFATAVQLWFILSEL